MQIEVSVEDVSSVKKKLTIEVPADVVAEELDSISQAWRRQVRLPGFRKGKAPLGLVKRNLRKEIREELIQKLIPESYKEALQQQSWTPVGNPQIGEIDLPDQGGPLRYEARLEVLPEVKLPNYEGLQIENVDTTVSAEEVTATLQELRERNARYEAVEDRPVQEGDRVLVDLHGDFLPASEESEESLPDPIDQEDVQVEVGGENTHEAFNQAMVGMNIAEEKTFDVSYPADYPEKNLAGKRVRFTVEVTDIQQKVIPELDDEFARSVGDFESLEQLQERILEDLKAQKEREGEIQLKNRLVDKLIEQTGFEVPESLIENRLDRKIQDLAYNISSRGVDPARAGVDWTRMREELRPQAENEIRAELILDKIAEEQKIEAEPEDEAAEMARTAESTNVSVEKVRGYFQAEGRLEPLRRSIRRQKALDWLKEHAVINE